MLEEGAMTHLYLESAVILLGDLGDLSGYLAEIVYDKNANTKRIYRDIWWVLESGPYGLEARRRASHQATYGFASYTVQVSALTFSYCCSPALTFSYCCSPIPFVVLLLVLNKNNNKMVERSGALHDIPRARPHAQNSVHFGPR